MLFRRCLGAARISDWVEILSRILAGDSGINARIKFRFSPVLLLRNHLKMGAWVRGCVEVRRQEFGELTWEG